MLKKQTTEIKANEFKDIAESYLDRNEYVTYNRPPYEVQKPYEESSEETEEEFDWYQPSIHEDESYFVFVNLQRKALQPGEQAYYCYGNRSNKFLLMNYGFCFKDNANDSYAVRMKMDINL